MALYCFHFDATKQNENTKISKLSQINRGNLFNKKKLCTPFIGYYGLNYYYKTLSLKMEWPGTRPFKGLKLFKSLQRYVVPIEPTNQSGSFKLELQYLRSFLHHYLNHQYLILVEMDSSTYIASACFKLVCDIVALFYCNSITQCYMRQWVQ